MGRCFKGLIIRNLIKSTLATYDKSFIVVFRLIMKMRDVVVVNYCNY